MTANSTNIVGLLDLFVSVFFTVLAAGTPVTTYPPHADPVIFFRTPPWQKYFNIMLQIASSHLIAYVSFLLPISRTATAD